MTWTLDSSIPTLDSGISTATLDGGPFGSSIFVWIPAYGAKKKVTSKIRKSEFGDGYSQRTGFGINNQAKEWPLMFDKRTQAEINSIEAFLDSRAEGQSFLWTPPFSNPTNETIRVYYEEYETEATDGGLTLSTTFKRAYGE